MTGPLRRHGLALAAIALVSAFYVSGTASVPFHPDETSLLYESRDFETWITQPWNLVWRPGGSPDDPSNYRALNAPLPKYVLAVGRRLAGYGPDVVSTDWNWNLSWETNAAAGALPPPGLLLGARLASALLLPLTLLSIYLAAIEADGRASGLLAVLLMGTNALVLLHGRRAMAEGTLLVGVALAMWGIAVAGRRPWLTGLAIAVAFSAKQSAAPLFLVGLGAVLWPRLKFRLAPRWKGGAVFLACFLLATAILQPYFWSNPVAAASEMISARQQLVASQESLFGYLAPGHALDSPTARAAALIGELFVVPPQFAEAGNYSAQTAAAEKAYLANPLNDLFRGMIWGGLIMALALLGFLSCFRWLPGGRTAAREPSVWLAAAGAIEILAILIANPLPFQRYYVVLIPFVTLWTAMGAVGLVRGIRPRGDAAPAV